MKARGRVTGLEIPFRAEHPIISFEIQASPEDLEKYKNKDLDISFVQHRARRSLDANACLWACLGDIAKAINQDNWSVYLLMLERYGKFTHILVKPEVVEAVRLQWRETKIVGETKVDGKPMVQMLCFFGSSTYDSAEFSRLLNGVISEMQDMHLEVPVSAEMKAILASLEKKE
uniref:NinB protein n=1 Tax=Siphoviridae sp. ct0Go27 TaxID=2827761 RepID=A0A8S5RW81_9CAUD|nr:MAG TPA: NinB protein [Siphoviridae sp. ct0Go27]